jgi:uncharacterized BrkB/YihY/UPF0761 family membrane protein
MNRWKDKLKQYEKEEKPSFWKDNKISFIIAIITIAAIVVASLI